jgi:hypothetical protein
MSSARPLCPRLPPARPRPPARPPAHASEQASERARACARRSADRIGVRLPSSPLCASKCTRVHDRRCRVAKPRPQRVASSFSHLTHCKLKLSSVISSRPKSGAGRPLSLHISSVSLAIFFVYPNPAAQRPLLVRSPPLPPLLSPPPPLPSPGGGCGGRGCGCGARRAGRRRARTRFAPVTPGAAETVKVVSPGRACYAFLRGRGLRLQSASVRECFFLLRPRFKGARMHSNTNVTLITHTRSKTRRDSEQYHNCFYPSILS